MSKRRAEYESDVSDNDDDFDEREFAAISDFNGQEMEAITKIAAKSSYINNTAGLLQKVQEITLPRDWPWIESLVVYTPKNVVVDDISDDLKREATFYQSALAATKQGLIQLDHSGVPYKRPTDFYAESVKPDSHMAKVKQVLINEKRRIEEVEERKRQRELKKYAKSVHAEKKRERASEKRKALEEIEQFKKRTKHNEASSSTFKGAIKKAAKEAKYGRPKKDKKNDSKSLNDFSSFKNKQKW